MVFAHDTEVALATAAALVNTLDGNDDHLTDMAALDTFVETWGFTGERRRDPRELTAVRALRREIRQLWECDRDSVVVLVNEMLREAKALPQLVRHDTWDYHLHATSADAPLATRMAVEAAMAFVDVVRADELDRLTICAAPDCENVTVDLTKNRSKRYCESGCGNRAAVAAYRARKAAAAQG
ncbi:MAG TPA: CGNR zinc finger domain-containing protein [Jatrophihabitantaceae bacterium]|jgi:predicted RNA-binding Zn ribbon-like protein|nr:CGNR zinc finger domain-containing protein [Jatrophihabitantaceae bacterium]